MNRRSKNNQEKKREKNVTDIWCNLNRREWARRSDPANQSTCNQPTSDQSEKDREHLSLLSFILRYSELDNKSLTFTRHKFN